MTRLGFDTAPIIYLVEANPKYDSLVNEVFLRVESGSCFGVTSAISLLEVLIQPLRKKEFKLEQRYREVLQNSQNFELKIIDLNLVERAAAIRAKYNLRIPDAIQIACAIESGCQGFLTNDPSFIKVTETKVFVLDNLLE